MNHSFFFIKLLKHTHQSLFGHLFLISSLNEEKEKERKNYQNSDYIVTLFPFFPLNSFYWICICSKWKIYNFFVLRERLWLYSNKTITMINIVENKNQKKTGCFYSVHLVSMIIIYFIHIDECSVWNYVFFYSRNQNKRNRNVFQRGKRLWNPNKLMHILPYYYTINLWTFVYTLSEIVNICQNIENLINLILNLFIIWEQKNYLNYILFLVYISNII